MVDLLDDVPPEAFLDGPPDADLVLRRTCGRFAPRPPGSGADDGSCW